MRDMFFTSQPMEMVDNREALELTFKMIKADTQLLYSSDYPHWDMDLPSTIYDLTFLSTGEAQHPGRQRPAAVQPRSRLFASKARTPRRPRPRPAGISAMELSSPGLTGRSSNHRTLGGTNATWTARRVQ